MSVINETCACGATFTVSDSGSASASAMARTWREGHKHAESVGICGDRPPALRIGDVDVPAPFCELKDGHTGAHSDGMGGHWAKIERPNPRPRIPLARRRA